MNTLRERADQIVHTHASTVFLVGEHAYKLKKPVDFGFLDYSTLALRRHFCEEEVRLNRRWCDGIYLGVVPLDGEGRPTEGEPHEWAVKMRRYEEADTLLAQVDAGIATADLLARVGRSLAARHADCPCSEEAQHHARYDAIAALALDNFEATRDTTSLPSSLHRALEQATRQQLQALRPLLERRARTHAAEIHGDLRLQHTLIRGDRVDFVDCIEFQPAFRMADPMADVGFLWMDLAVRGHSALADAFLQAYLDASGDAEGRQRLPFEAAYRSVVRAKVAELEAASADVSAEQAQRARARARRHWLWAAGLLLPPDQRPVLLGVGGLPGTGKSALAAHLASAHGFTWVRADVRRKQLAGLPPEANASAAFGEGLYTAEHTARVYDACLSEAAAVVAEGGRAVVDATFSDPAHRDDLHRRAVELGVGHEVVLCEVPHDEALRRIAHRSRGPSDADATIYEAARARWPGSVAGAPLSTAGSLPATQQRLDDWLVARGWHEPR